VKRTDIEVPKGDRDILMVPAARELPGLVHANRELLRTHDYRLSGRSAAEFRDAARHEVMEASGRYTTSLGVSASDWSGKPVVMTGHQPEFTHPGIWVKNHLAAKLARATAGVALNLVVDNDVPREGELAFPVHAHGAFTQHGVQFAEVDSSRAWEEHTDKTSWRFDRLAGEVNDLLPLDEDLVIARFMADVSDCMAKARDVAHLMTLLRRRYEERIGLGNLEIPVSVMSDTQAFALFVLGVAADARRFAETYNAAVHEYRRVNGVRSTSHPVPDLGIEEGRVELPFWVWRPGGERLRLWITTGETATFLMDESPIFTLRDADRRGMLAGKREAFDAAAEKMLAEGEGHFRIRPRAVSNTLFCRMFLSDVFIHGVGGAKYDAVTDEIAREYFGVEPPGLIACSATLHLPIDVATSRQDDLRRLRWELRDSLYNADRHMDDRLRRSAPVKELIAGKRRLVSRNQELRRRPTGAPRSTLRSRRRDVFLDIRRHNDDLAALIEPSRRALREEIARVESHVGDETVVKQRGYAFVLYPERQLLDFYAENIDIG